MKKLLLPLLLLTAATAFAQPEGRVFTVTTNQTYTDLPAPTVITTAGWDDFAGKVPIGFNFTMMGKTTDTMYFDENVNLGADMLMKVPGTTHGLAFFTDFIDRSNAGKPVSTVSYQNFITGAPSVTKIQWKNVGFYGEQDVSGTLNDSVNFQVWLREVSGDVEVHFGPSGIQSPYEDIFDFTGPVFCFVKNIDTSAGSFDYLYYVSATSPTPKVDSMSFAALFSGGTPVYPAWPANGTVFKFSKPASGGVNGVQLNEYAQVAPTLISNDCVVTLSKTGFNGNIYLIDMSGRVVLGRKANEGKNILDMGGLVPGNYVLNIRSEQESVFYKITKQ